MFAFIPTNKVQHIVDVWKQTYPVLADNVITFSDGDALADHVESRCYGQSDDCPYVYGAVVFDKIDLLNANVLDVTTSDGYMAITVVDETVAGTVQVSLIFDVETKDLSQWSLVEPSGAELTFSLYDVEKDVEIPRSYFSIPATYKGVDPATRR